MTYTVRVNFPAGMNNEFVVTAESASVDSAGVLTFWTTRGPDRVPVAAFAAGQWLAFSEENAAQVQ